MAINQAEGEHPSLDSHWVQPNLRSDDGGDEEGLRRCCTGAFRLQGRKLGGKPLP
ncbi:uncharacterized protein H6S33_011522, partial [Morchella sextelata]|uniref:uncharacterized protein n=1 Tax=Morchella sextelata TaxID=1174677 RepID=UPI001D04B627